MNYLLKIVEGPNKGAEIALVEGVAVTLGKGEDCDIVLADSTMPDAPVKLEATSGGVLVDGEAVEPFRVKTLGTTSFAVGPADAPWRELSWPKNEVVEESHGDEGRETREGGVETQKTPPVADERPKPRKKSGCLGCVVAVAVLLLIAAGLCWFFREQVRPYAEKTWERIPNIVGKTSAPISSPVDAPPQTIESIAAKYGLSITNRANGPLIFGNLPTRGDRLAATAEAYAVQPGVSLDISDDESFRTAAEDALFTLTEGRLKVAAATNRFLVIAGSSSSPAALASTLASLNSDMPKLRDVDVTHVSVGNVEEAPLSEQAKSTHRAAYPMKARARSQGKDTSAYPSFPVCGILTTPYRCLVLQNGARIMEGGSVGDSVIMKIEPDSVTVTNAAGRFTWKP